MQIINGVLNNPTNQYTRYFIYVRGKSILESPTEDAIGELNDGIGVGGEA